MTPRVYGVPLLGKESPYFWVDWVVGWSASVIRVEGWDLDPATKNINKRNKIKLKIHYSEQIS
jgi:hypothetical protein